MNRTQLQQLADERIRDAAALLNASQWSGAYYLAGYAVECALKACIAKMTNQYDFPDKEIANKSYIHDLSALVRVAELAPLHAENVEQNPAFKLNWLIVKDWSERSRYDLIAEGEARSLFSAITDSTNGVLPWIKVHW